MYKKFVLLALAVPFFLTGCWDKKDPEDRAFIITLGVDAAENGCHFTFMPQRVKLFRGRSRRWIPTPLVRRIWGS